MFLHNETKDGRATTIERENPFDSSIFDVASVIELPIIKAKHIDTQIAYCKQLFTIGVFSFA